MPSSWSSSLRFELQFTGENINLWGDKLDATLARVDDAIAGYVAVPIAGDYALSSANNNASPDEARRAHLKLTGAPAANFNLTLPAGVQVLLDLERDAEGGDDHHRGGRDGLDRPRRQGPGVVGRRGRQHHQLRRPGLKPFIAASALAATGTLPGLTGNAGKYLFTDGANALWRQLSRPPTSPTSTARCWRPDRPRRGPLGATMTVTANSIITPQKASLFTAVATAAETGFNAPTSPPV